MDHDRRKNLMLVFVAALFVGALNLLVWMVARAEVIPPINNIVLWSSFALLSVAVIPWAISQLGLQPLVISLSYVAGGFVAFRGMEGSAGIHLAEVTTAGAAYGAFGAVAIGNATHKIRLAFFDRRQTALIFIILFLLLFMALLNSEIIGSANPSGFLKAIILPFALSGMVVSLGWTICVRGEAGRKSNRVPKSRVMQKSAEENVPAGHEESTADEVVFQMPVESDENEENDEDSFIPRLSLPEEVQFEREDPDNSDDDPIRSSAEQDLTI
jgi:signal transduction histidine kinase